MRGLGMKVGPGARIGLTGGNGAGKSTLLRILAGSEEVDGGEVTWRRGLRTAYLPQHVVGDDRTPPEVVRAARPEIAELKVELDACETQLGAPEVSSDLRRMQRVLERHGRLLRRFTELGGRGFEGEVRGRLQVLGLGETDMERAMGRLERRATQARGSGRLPDPNPRRPPAGRARNPPRRGPPGARLRP